MVLEAPLVAMNRQLPKEHPIYDLLKPHLVGTGFINDKAQDVSWKPCHKHFNSEKRQP